MSQRLLLFGVDLLAFLISLAVTGFLASRGSIKKYFVFTDTFVSHLLVDSFFFVRYRLCWSGFWIVWIVGFFFFLPFCCPPLDSIADPRFVLCCRVAGFSVDSCWCCGPTLCLSGAEFWSSILSARAGGCRGLTTVLLFANLYFSMPFYLIGSLIGFCGPSWCCVSMSSSLIARHKKTLAADFNLQQEYECKAGMDGMASISMQ